MHYYQIYAWHTYKPYDASTRRLDYTPVWFLPPIVRVKGGEDMAKQQLVDSRMRLILDDGVDDATGKQQYKRKGFNNVKTDATADQLYTIATVVAPLQERSLMDVERTDSSEISENEGA